MRVVEHAVYLGPNLFAGFPVIRLTLDLGPLEAWPTTRLGHAFVDGLLAALPGLREHGCSFATEGGFVRRLREEPGTWLGHVLEHAALELQSETGADVSFGKTRGTGSPGIYDVVYAYRDEEVGLEAGRLARLLLLSLVPAEIRMASDLPSDFDWRHARESFGRFAQDRALGPSTRAIVDAAEARGIPWLRLDRQSLVQLGHGRHQRRLRASITSRTNHIAVDLASDKARTHEILSAHGIPVACQRLVYDEEAAVRAADQIGYAVVTKPIDANHGRGVSIRLTDPESVRIGFRHARRHATGVLVESFVPGDDHRLLVVDGKMVAAAHRIPGHVVGDGVHTIAQLVEIVNRDPRRGIGHEKVLTRIELDSQAHRLLDLLGLGPDSVPPAGGAVALRATGNLSTGGTATDVTDRVHPDNAAMAERASRAIGLDVCGVDFLTTDITRSYHEVGGAVCELNAAPGLRMHVAPSEGRPRHVAGAIVDMLFPPGSPSRVPIATITGTNGKTTTTRMVGHVMASSGRTVGMATTDGVYIGGRLAVPGDMTGPFAARAVLRDPTIDCAVLETARGGLLRRGMAFRSSEVGACLNVQGDHLGNRGIERVDQLAAVKRIVIEAAEGTAILNADDPHCLRMAAWSRAENLCYVTTNSDHPLVREHIRAGGLACVLEYGIAGSLIVFYEHGAHLPLMWTHEIPATMAGRAFHNVQNAMFAAAIAHGIGATLDEVRRGLSTFDTSFLLLPGRTNIYDELPFRVVLDYGHNAAAVRAMVRFCDELDVVGRRICVLSVPGDRRDEDVREIAFACAGHFDRFVCRRDDDPRGRGPTEIPELLRDALVDAGVPSARVSIVVSEAEALDAGLSMARRGDLLLVFGDKVERCWDQIVGHRVVGGPWLPRPDRTTACAPVRAPRDREVAPQFTAAGLVRDVRGVHLARGADDGDGD